MNCRRSAPSSVNVLSEVCSSAPSKPRRHVAALRDDDAESMARVGTITAVVSVMRVHSGARSLSSGTSRLHDTHRGHTETPTEESVEAPRKSAGSARLRQVRTVSVWWMS